MPPVTIMVKPVSSDCNMRCRYCFYIDVASRRACTSMGRMSSSTLENLVRRAMRYADGQLTLAFQGGEPTLAGLDFYRELVRYEKMYNAKGLRVCNAIQTNGYALSDEMIDFFVREGFLIGVSFDGTPAIHDRLRVDAAGNGTSSRVLDTLLRLQARGAEFNVLCVVNRYAAEKPEEVFRFLAPYGYIQYIACMDDLDGSLSPHSLTAEAYGQFLKKSFDLYYESYKRNRFVSIRNFDNYLAILSGGQPESCGMCGVCSRYFLIEADGGVYPCDFYVLDQWRMGNVNDSSFFTLAQSPVAQRFVDESRPLNSACRSCRWYFLCRGGCKRDREALEEGQPGRNKWCQAFQALFEYAYPRMLEMAKNISGKRM